MGTVASVPQTLLRNFQADKNNTYKPHISVRKCTFMNSVPFNFQAHWASGHSVHKGSQVKTYEDLYIYKRKCSIFTSYLSSWPRLHKTEERLTRKNILLFYKKTWEPSKEMKTDKWENLCVFMLRFVTKTVMGKYDWTRMYSDPSCTFKEKDIPFFPRREFTCKIRDLRNWCPGVLWCASKGESGDRIDFLFLVFWGLKRQYLR